MTRWKTTLCKSLLALTATLLTFVACELAVRWLGGTPEVIPIGISSEERIYRRSKNPYLSYELKPNYRNDEADLKFDHPRTNSHGQRDIERSLDKPPGTKRIVLLGDSVVAGFGIREIDDLLSRQLEHLYAEENVEVLNLAVSGYCTRSEVELLKTKGIRYDPDLVILVFVENDFHNFNREARYVDGIAGRPRVVNSLYRTSSLFRMACLKLDLFGFGMESDPAYWNQLALGENNVEEGLGLLRQLALEHGFETIVVAWPTFTNTQIEYNDVMRMPESDDELIIQCLGQLHGLTVIRLDQPFRRHWEALSPRPNPRVYYTVGGDEMHPTIVGHKVAAQLLKTIIDEKRLLEPSASLRTVATAPAAPPAAAIEAAKALGTDKSDYSALHYNLGKDLMKEGKTDEAMKYFEELVRSSPRYAADAHTDMGVILFDRGQIDEAIAHYKSALEANPGNYFAHVNLGNAWRHEGHIPQALASYRQAVRMRPEQLEGHYNLASTLASQGKYDEAARHFAEAARIDPDDVRVAKRLGHTYQSLGRFSQAVSPFQRAVQLEPRKADNYNTLGFVLSKAGRTSEAIQQYRAGLRLQPNDAEIHFNLGKALSSQNHFPDALVHLQRACSLVPKNVNAQNSLGIVLAKMGRNNEAIQQFSHALKLDPQNANVRRNLANARAMQRRVLLVE